MVEKANAQWEKFGVICLLWDIDEKKTCVRRGSNVKDCPINSGDANTLTKRYQHFKLSTRNSAGHTYITNSYQ
jgi:hypothetical protein